MLFFYEIYLELWITVLVDLTEVGYTGNNISADYCYFMSMALMMVTIVLPISIIMVFIRISKEELSKTEFRERHGHIYESLDIERRGRTIFFYTFNFMIRRAVFAFSSIILKESPTL